MRYFLSIFLILLSGYQVFGQLSGTKTINPVGGDYPTFLAAINALVSQGINGPVVLNVANGTYTEQIRIREIPGSSAVNTVTIQSQSLDSSKVVLSFESTLVNANWTLKIDSTDYIKIRQITVQANGSNYGHCIEINGTATNVSIENCRLVGYNTTSYLNNYALIYCLNDPTDKISILNNLFSSGSDGVSISGVSNLALSNGIKILNNVFSDQNEHAVWLSNQNAPVINNNTIVTKSDPAYGIYLEYCDNAIEVQNNKISLPLGQTGIYLSYCDGGSLQKGLVANNFVYMPSGTSAYGMYLSNSTYQKIYHNTVSIKAITSGDFGAFYLTGGSNIDVRNNIFANFGENYAYNIKTTSAIEFSDYNDYYSNGNYLGFWTSNFEHLADLKAANLKDANSISFNPVFVSDTDLHSTSFRIDNKGTNLGITKDIDGENRVNSDIGADEFTGTGSALSAGSYTIGGASPNFATFSQAVTALNNYGISGPVTLNVRNGSYNEQLSIYPVAGADNTNKVTFQSESSDSTKVELFYNSAVNNNYVIRFVGADYVTFRKMTITAVNTTYSKVIWFAGSSGTNAISNCIINSDISGTTADAAIYSYESNISNILLSNNSISGGRNGISFNTNNNGYIKGTQVLRNSFSQQKGYYNYVIYLRYNDAPEVSENTVSNSISTDFWGIYLINCINDLKVLSNKISSSSGTGGIYLYTCQAIVSKRGLVANNFIDIGGTSTAYGIYTQDSDFLNIYQNSIRITSTNTSTGRAYYNSTNSSNITLKNNIFANLGDGYAFYSEGTTSGFLADYNDYYSTGNFLTYWNGTNQADLAAFKLACSPLEVNSISVNPSFLSATNLHASSSFLKGIAPPLAEVTSDIDGQTRSLTAPDIGADEFIFVSSPLAGGTYTIGGSSPNYANFSAAVNDLNNRGIAGPVIFNVRDGLYNEQLSILDINGANDINTITFQSESGDSSKVELYYTSNINNKQVIQLTGTDNISFKKMTISATDLNYGLVFYLRGGLQKVSILNCILNGVGGYGSETNISVIYSGTAILSDFDVENCQINGGHTGIYLESPYTSLSTGTRLIKNSFSGQYYYAVLLKYHAAPRVESNLISNSTSASCYGINLQYCTNDYQVLSNTINYQTGLGGIYIYYCPGTTTKKGIVANNIVAMGGTGNTSGISTYFSDYVRIFFNTVKITSTDVANGKAFYNYQGTNIEVKNNILSNFGGGYAYSTNNLTSITLSDYNDLFTTGSYIGFWNANYIDLGSFKTASGKDVNSVSVNPVFVSSDNLHSASSYIDNKGTPISAVPFDYDGELRSVTFPDIGADEFNLSNTSLAGNYTIGGSSPDFETFSLAANALNKRGVSGPVTFLVRNGSYSEHFELFEVPGASAVNNITFKSESGDSTAVILSYNPASSLDNYVIKLSSADYITFQKLTIAGMNSANSDLIIIFGNVTHLKILNNVLISSIGASANVIYSADGNITYDIQIKNNNIVEGGRGISMNGNVNSKSAGTVIIGNIISNQDAYGIYLVDQDAPVVRSNSISTSDYSFQGIYLSYCDNSLVVAENKVTNDNYCFAIYIDYCNGTLVNKGLVANNFVTVSGTNYAYGIYMNYAQYQDVLFNSVNITSTYSNIFYKVAFCVTGGGNISVKNNIFANSQGGVSYYINSPTAIIASDYNNYFSTTDLAYWGNTSVKTSLAVLRAANSMDAHSLSVNPMFASDTDLRIKQTLLNKAATPSVLVPKDIFGTLRDLTVPDIGAVEYFCTTPVFNVSVSTACLNDSTLFIDNSTGISYGSNYSYDFDNDFNPDTTFTSGGSQITHLFTTPGNNVVNFSVSQIAGCNNYIALNATVNPSPSIEVLTTGATCGNSNGAASANITQATGPFSYLWSNGNKSSTASNLALGQYSVSVKSVNNCVGSQTFEIGNALKVIVNVEKPSTCGAADGIAYAIVSGGTEPYKYVWSSGETADTSYILSAGAQFVKVTDFSGCSSLGAINIPNDGSGPQISLAKLINNNCYGDRNGAVDISVTGGAAPYKTQWSNGAITEDISSLSAGIFDVQVTDNTGCSASASYTIEQPVFLNVSAVVTDASCGGSDGQAVALVGGGSKPYKYEWTGGKTSPILENLPAGVYSVKVTDNNLCNIIVPVLINNTGGPKVAIKSLKGTSCSNSANGAIDINISGGTPLYSYFWLPGGQTTQDIINLSNGDYQVKVTDNSGCVGVTSTTIKQEPPQINPICMVTVDTVSGKNLIIWQKAYLTDVASYNIYRESSSKEIFQLIGNVPITDKAMYLDSIADPSVRSWKYKISVVDVCGNESDLSAAHKTIHLTQNLGLNKSVNLIWDSYEGFAVSTYNILRYTSSEGWITLTSVPSNLTSYTDKPPLDQDLIYVIEAVHPSGGCSTLKASNYNSSRSNRQPSSVKSTTGLVFSESLNSLNMYPNPAKDNINLSLSQADLKLVRVEIIDVNGQILRNYKYSTDKGQLNENIDLSMIPKGIYILRVSDGKGFAFRKLVVQP